ncbi:S8 family serine peptidase [uncultured Dokdonia sp.]|uniref:S8 family serine peptidase n=1 Tax=uncultured Dokdonia sp. TaxID=575653 RepID=UPI00261A1AF4|nr:S8 family serine peptidase [uncultured Dokdonia sp.]
MKNIIFIISLFLISCGSDPINKEYIKAPKDISKLVFSEYDSLQIHNWHFKDIIQDSLPGISLTRLYDEIIKNKKGKKIIVAVLDTEIDIEHPALKDHIWENPNETLNNIDDDGNGFVDDINGWNFLGGKNKTNTFYQKFDYTRIVNKLATHPSIISKDTISKIYKHYSKAHDKYIDELNNINYIIEKGNVIIEKYKNQLAHPLLPLEKNITIELLDSLIENHGLKKKEINLVYLFTEFGENFKDLQNDSIRYSDKIKYQLNLDYNCRLP